MKISKLKDVIYELVNVAEYEFTPTYFKNIDNACVEICEKLDKLADYEDRLEQGLLIDVPVKPEDTVYIIVKKDISPQKVIEVHISCNGIEIITKRRAFHISNIGKTVFLTRSEAEKALAKMKKED